MVDSYLRQDALAHRGLAAARSVSPGEADVRLGLEAPRTQLALRGDAGDPAFARAVRRVTGTALPEPSRASVAKGVSLLWMGPDEWLVVGDEDPQLLARLDSALARLHALVSDVSSSRVILGLSGPRAAATLAKGCAVDLHSRVFPEGQVAQSVLARTHVMLHRLQGERGFHIYVHRSFADYTFSWLEDAAAEYGVSVG